jgi:hypothetical protein
MDGGGVQVRSSGGEWFLFTPHEYLIIIFYNLGKARALRPDPRMLETAIHK